MTYWVWRASFEAQEAVRSTMNVEAVDRLFCAFFSVCMVMPLSLVAGCLMFIGLGRLLRTGGRLESVGDWIARRR